MQNLTDWFNTLETLEKIYWTLAIPASIAFLIQMVLAFMGGDSDDMPSSDAEIDADAGIGFQFFTLRNLIAFFTIMSWTGIACIDSGYSNGTTITVSVTAGLVMMSIMATLMYYMYKLRESGTLKLSNAVGKRGETYLRIPANKKGFGKIQLTIQGSVHEFNAISAETEEIPTGTIIQVIEVVEGNVMLVKPL
jgi:hypothetical protein